MRPLFLPDPLPADLLAHWIVHGAEPTAEAMFYDLAMKIRPSAKELQDRVRAASGLG